MRITDKVVQDRMLRNLQRATERLTQSQERMSTNRNIKLPSDDPIGFMGIMNCQRDLFRLRQTIKNAGNASSLLSQTDVALQQVGDVLLDARNKATTMATDTAGADERSAVAGEVQLMINGTLQKANTMLGGRYIFSGHRIFTQPYQEIDGEIEYFGDQGEINQRIELTGSMIVNTPGSEAFGSSASGVFRVLGDLRDALEANGAVGIQESISSIDAEIDRIAAVRGEIGVKINRVDASVDELSITELSLTNELSRIQDADMAMQAGEYIATQEAYQAALEVTASTLKLPRLLDYLR